jgi:bifunctional ADP-heptose synthase (sugar kinase/adenylyltransferase)
LRIITGHFDPVHAAHARLLRELHDGSCTVVVLTNSDQPISSQRARAEVLAGLSSVDWVIPTDGSDLESVLRLFPEAEVIRDEPADAQRTRNLMVHVRSRQAAT